MSCERIAELLPWYAPGNLGPEEAAEVVAHLAICSECRSELAQTLRVRNALAEALNAEPFPLSALWDLVSLRTKGLPIWKILLDPDLFGFGLFLGVRERALSLEAELRLFGRRIPIFAL